MNRHRAGWLAVLLLLGGGLLAGASKGADDAPNPIDELKKQLQRKISFDFKNEPLAEAMTFVLSVSKANVVCQIEGDPHVTLKVQDVPMFDALTQMMEQAGLEFQPRSMALYIVKKGTPKPEVLKPMMPVAEWEKKFHEKLQKKATFEFVDTPLDETITYLRALSGCTILLDQALLKKPRTINLKVKDIPLEAAILQILALNELCYRLRDEALFVHDQWLFAEKGKEELFNEDAEVAKALEAFDTRVSFEFVETPLEEIAGFLEPLAKQKFSCVGVERLEVSLRVQEMKLGNALRWVARLAGAKIVLKDGVLGSAKR